MKALRGLEKFSGGWVVHKVIIVSVRVLYVGFSISLVLVFRFRVFGFSGFQVFRFFRTLGFSDGTGQDAELDNMYLNIILRGNSIFPLSFNTYIVRYSFTCYVLCFKSENLK